MGGEEEQGIRSVYNDDSRNSRKKYICNETAESIVLFFYMAKAVIILTPSSTLLFLCYFFRNYCE